MEAHDRYSIRVQEIPDKCVEEFVIRTFSIPYNTSDIQNEDEDMEAHDRTSIRVQEITDILVEGYVSRHSVLDITPLRHKKEMMTETRLNLRKRFIRY